MQLISSTSVIVPYLQYEEVRIIWYAVSAAVATVMRGVPRPHPDLATGVRLLALARLHEDHFGFSGQTRTLGGHKLIDYMPANH